MIDRTTRRTTRIATTLVLLALAVCSCSKRVRATQVADMDADVSVAEPRYSPGAGPVALIDGAHGNFHTVDGGYAPFARVLRNDGMRVTGSTAPFSDSLLDSVHLVIIANPSADSGSAYTEDEIATLVRYVRDGGALFLIVDHAPFPAAARALAAAFGAEWLNVYVDGPGVFSLRNGGLADDPVLNGVTEVRSFTGSCFTAPDARPLMRLTSKHTMQSLNASGSELSEKSPAKGYLQGAIQNFGAGRLALFGEAGMFTAQVVTIDGKAKKMGFTARDAKQNKTLLLNIVHWLVEDASQSAAP